VRVAHIIDSRTQQAHMACGSDRAGCNRQFAIKKTWVRDAPHMPELCKDATAGMVHRLVTSFQASICCGNQIPSHLRSQRPAYNRYASEMIRPLWPLGIVLDHELRRNVLWCAAQAS